MYVCATYVLINAQKRVLDPLKVEFHVIVSHPV